MLACRRVYDHPRYSTLPHPRRSPSMQSNGTSKLVEIVRNETRELLNDWMKQQLAADTMRPDLINECELREQSQQFLSAFSEAVQHSSLTDIQGRHGPPCGSCSITSPAPAPRKTSSPQKPPPLSSRSNNPCLPSCAGNTDGMPMGSPMTSGRPPCCWTY